MQVQHRSLPNFEKTLDKSKNIESAHHKAIREKLFSFCENQRFSDFCIIASDDERFHTHKCVLSASSDYYMAMIGNDPEMKIYDINSEILKPVLAFMYTGTINLQSKTVDDVLRAANFFQIKSLIMECYTFMGEDLHVGNCLGIAMFAEQQGLMELHKNASEFACKYFDDIQKEEKFLELNEDQLGALISSKQLCVSSEEIVFLSIIKWISHDQPNRKKSAFNLFSKVRYQLLSFNFIKQNSSILKMYQQIECTELICCWLEWQYSREMKLMDVLKAKNGNQLVLLSDAKKQIYNPESNRWICEQFSEIPFNRAVKVNTKLIFSNGIELTCLDLNSNEKTKLPFLPDNRISFRLAVLNDELYAVGGCCNRHTVWKPYVDKFDFSSGKWQSVAPMTRVFFCHHVAVAGGLIYVAGDGVMECYNPISNEWTAKPFIKKEIRSFAFIGVNEKLYVVGGIFKKKRVKSLYSYDPLLEKWETQPDMRLKLSSAKCTSWNNQLIVFGGFQNGIKFRNIIQKYNPTSKTWTRLTSPDCFDRKWCYEILSL